MRRAQGRLRNGPNLTTVSTTVSTSHDRHQRSVYQRGLLNWLKGEPGGAQEMRAAVAAIESTQRGAFWLAALAFLEAFADDPGPDSQRVRAAATPLCVRIEKEFRRLADGAPAEAEELARDLWRHLARESLAQAAAAWSEFAADHDAPGLVEFHGASARFNERAAGLDHPDLSGLAAELAEFASWLSFRPSNMSEAIALEVATALLLAEEALAGGAAPGAAFAQQCKLMRKRLRACMRGKLLRTPPSIPFLAQLSRKAEERLLQSQIAGRKRADRGSPMQTA